MRLKQILLIFSALFASCGNELRLTTTSYPDDENVRAKEGGKETPFPWSLAVHHQSHAFGARLCHSKNEAAEEEAGLTMYPWLASQFNYTFRTKIKIKDNFKTSFVSGNFFKSSRFWLSLYMLFFLVRSRHPA